MTNVSGIITAREEPETIVRAVKAMLPVVAELIVVAPDAKTLKKAKSAGARTIKDKGEGKPAAMNLAIKEAKGQILVFSDGDVWTENATLLLPHFKDKNVGAVCGRPVSASPRSTRFGYWSHLLTTAAHKERTRHKMIDCTGYLFAARKSLIPRLPKHLLAEDAYISAHIHQKKRRIVYEPQAKAHVLYPDSFKDWILQKKRSAGGYDQLEKMGKPSMMRSFRKEMRGTAFVFFYVKSLFEAKWSTELLFARAYLWLRIWYDLRIKKEHHKKTWQRVESTK